MKTKNGHILTFSEKMQISAILCFATCDWFCPMTSLYVCGTWSDVILDSGIYSIFLRKGMTKQNKGVLPKKLQTEIYEV